MHQLKRLSEAYRVDHPGRFRLKNCDPADTGSLQSKKQAANTLAMGVERLSALQEKLYADNHWAVLLIFQAMDAAGKDSTIKHVMSGINPQGCQVYSFKTPSEQELDHTFLWRTTCCLPERGRIGIFNRSYYEEVLIVRVHPEWLQHQRLPPIQTGKQLWTDRFNDINDYEHHLSRNGVQIIKFFLNVSRQEQRRRFLKRLEDPSKHWKFSLADVEERQHWAAYMMAYEEMIRHTSTTYAPWYVVPADHKWFTRMVVLEAIIKALESLNLQYPSVTDSKRKELAQARRVLSKKGG